MNMSKNLVLYSSDGVGDKSEIQSIESEIGYTLPPLYKNMLLQHKNIDIFNDLFDFYKPDYQETAQSNIFFNSLDGDESLLHDLDVVKNWWEHDALVPFGRNASGDEICFDYRLDPKSKNPPIVTIIHDDWNDDDTQKIYHVADNFREFLNILYSPGKERYEELCEVRKESGRPLPFEWTIPDDDTWG